MTSPLGLVFTIDIDGKPTIAFEARQLRDASELCNEEWLRADLNTLSSNDVPLCGIGSKMRARIASESERAVYLEAAQGAKPSDDIFLVYLVELDGVGLKAKGK
jgi:hypothetical protein